jgi:hypothetical protein
VAGKWFSLVSSTNETDYHDITEILLKVALNTITLTLPIKSVTLRALYNKVAKIRVILLDNNGLDIK